MWGEGLVVEGEGLVGGVEGWWVKKACVGKRTSFSDHFTNGNCVISHS